MPLRLAALAPIAVRLPMKKPMKMSGVEIRTADNVLVRAEAAGGLVGWGEAASAPTMTGETMESMVAAVKVLAPFITVLDAEDLDAVHAEMDRRLYGNLAAKSAIDMALHDLLARARGVPLHALLGARKRERVPALWLVGTGSTEGDLEEVKARRAEGIVAFKIKVGTEAPEKDAARTRRLAAVLGDAALVCADANQGWTPDEAIAYLREIGDARLDFFEQPVRGDDLDGMARVAASSRIPIGADEGLHGLADIERHHALRAARGGSLKTIKCGGVRAVYEAGRLCERLGMQVNLACKVAESSIATAAVLHLAATLPTLDWGVSLSSQYLADDLVRVPCRVVRGYAGIPQGAGLGIEVDEAQVRRYAVTV